MGRDKQYRVILDCPKCGEEFQRTVWAASKSDAEEKGEDSGYTCPRCYAIEQAKKGQEKLAGFDLPEITTGSAGQNKYATDERTKFFVNLKANTPLYKEKLVDLFFLTEDAPEIEPKDLLRSSLTQQQAQERFEEVAFHAIDQELRKITSTKFWIDYSGNQVFNLVETEDLVARIWERIRAGISADPLLRIVFGEDKDTVIPIFLKYIEDILSSKEMSNKVYEALIFARAQELGKYQLAPGAEQPFRSALGGVFDKGKIENVLLREFLVKKKDEDDYKEKLKKYEAKKEAHRKWKAEQEAKKASGEIEDYD